MSENDFFLCDNCKNIFLLEQNSQFCPNCGQKDIDNLEGRFILRCKSCSLTQNKRAFTQLHGSKALRCQSSTCNGLIKAIVVKKKASSVGKRTVPKVPTNRFQSRILKQDVEVEEEEVEDDTPSPFGNVSSKGPVEKKHAGIAKGDFLKLEDINYRIIKKLGTGGMGAVWMAKSTKGNQVVAIKEFFYSRYHDPETGKNHCERYWKRESKISKIQTQSKEPSMDYIGSLKIEQFKIPEYYIFLEFIDGTALDEWYTNRYKNLSDLNIKELRMIVRDILQPIARHIYYSHQKGIIHRDLTVQNLILQEIGEDEFRPIVIDWGVAKERPKEALYNPRKPYYVSSTPEATGIRNRGSPPEVMAGFQPIAVTDVYMLGHIMFYLFSGGNYAGTAATHEDFVLHPRDYNSDLPEDFNKIVEYMTQYEPADRMPNMIKVHESLQWLLDSTEPLQNKKLEQPTFAIYCEWNESYIDIPEKKILKIGRDEIISAGTNPEMDGHLYKAFIPLEDNKYQLALFIDEGHLYVRDLYSKDGTYINNLTSTNQQVYNDIPIKGLDNCVIMLSDANLNTTTVEIEYRAPDDQVYRIPFKIVKR